MADPLLVTSAAAAVAGSTAVLTTATGELLLEKTGIYNISLEGVMLVGALSGYLGARAADSWVIGLFAGALIGALFALAYGYLTVVLRADMIVVGVAMILIATGVVNAIGADYVGEAAASQIPIWNVPVLSDIPYLGPAVFEQSIMTYVAFLLPLGAWWLLSRTRHGLNMQAIGENPAAADNAGIAVVGWRLTYTAIGGAFAGVGGAILTLSIVGAWVSTVTAGQGWIAFALVFFAGWRPPLVLLGAYLFGALTVLGFVGQAEGWDIPSQVFTGLPYAATVLLMILRAWMQRRRGVTSWPAALGRPFYRG